MSKTIKDLLKREIPLETKLKVLNTMSIIDAIVEAGYREDKGWGWGEAKQLEIINECAKKLTEEQLKLINKDMKIPLIRKKSVPIMSKEETIEHSRLINMWETESSTMSKEEIKRFTILDKKMMTIKKSN